jgi:hypothetical protein
MASEARDYSCDCVDQFKIGRVYGIGAIAAKQPHKAGQPTSHNSPALHRCTSMDTRISWTIPQKRECTKGLLATSLHR